MYRGYITIGAFPSHGGSPVVTRACFNTKSWSFMTRIPSWFITAAGFVVDISNSFIETKLLSGNQTWLAGKSTLNGGENN